jgi:hypothetical protein
MIELYIDNKVCSARALWGMRMKATGFVLLLEKIRQAIQKRHKNANARPFYVYRIHRTMLKTPFLLNYSFLGKG